jgi:hypothetical protein
MAATASSVSCWTSAISAAISLVARLERSASLRTSSATTAKPLPCSPARAASIAAFSASRFVCSAMSSIVSTMAPICSPLAPSSVTLTAARWTTSRIRPMPATVSRTEPAPPAAAEPPMRPRSRPRRPPRRAVDGAHHVAQRSFSCLDSGVDLLAADADLGNAVAELDEGLEDVADLRALVPRAGADAGHALGHVARWPG